MSITITQYKVGGYDKNLAYLVHDTHTKTAAIVDPSGDCSDIFVSIIESELTVEHIWLTHTHADHYDSLEAVLGRYGPLPIYVHTTGARVLAGEGYQHSQSLLDGDEIRLGQTRILFMHTPGHSPDSGCFFCPSNTPPILITGDTLFVQGCGRTSHTHVRDLYCSLTHLKQLPPETIIYPGHDYGPTPYSTLGHECTHNRFLTAPDLETFIERRL